MKDLAQRGGHMLSPDDERRSTSPQAMGGGATHSGPHLTRRGNAPAVTTTPLTATATAHLERSIRRRAASTSDPERSGVEGPAVGIVVVVVVVVDVQPVEAR